MRQVITITQDGSIHGLQHKKNAGLDLKQFGKARIKRATLISFDEQEQKWFIHWPDSQEGYWSKSIFEEANVPFDEFNGELHENPEFWCETPIYFEDYDDAVKAEVAVIQSKQLTGRFFSDIGVS